MKSEDPSQERFGFFKKQEIVPVHLDSCKLEFILKSAGEKSSLPIVKVGERIERRKALFLRPILASIFPDIGRGEKEDISLMSSKLRMAEPSKGVSSLEKEAFPKKRSQLLSMEIFSQDEERSEKRETCVSKDHFLFRKGSFGKDKKSISDLAEKQRAEPLVFCFTSCQ